MLATVNSWQWEHKLLQTKQNTPKLLNWKFSEIHCRVNLVHFCLPHVWCSLNDFGADVGGKVTGTKSTAGLLTAGGQGLDTHWHSSPSHPHPHGLQASDHDRAERAWLLMGTTNLSMGPGKAAHFQ